MSKRGKNSQLRNLRELNILFFVTAALIIFFIVFVLALGEPQISVISPLNNTNVTTFPYANLTASIGNYSNIWIYASDNFSNVWSSLVYYNSTPGNLSFTYNWSIPVTISTNNTVFLAHFDNQSSYGENQSYAKDFSGIGNNINLTSIVFVSTPLGQGIDFDGRVSMRNATPGNSSSLRPQSYTIMAWIYMKGNGTTVATGSGGTGVYPIIAKGMAEAETGAADVTYIFGVNATTRTLAADFENQTGSGNFPIVGTAQLSFNTWYHIALVVQNAQYQSLYLNGVLDKNQSTAGSPNPNSSMNLGIGQAYQSTGVVNGAWNGTIDDLMLINRTLSTAEIVSYYNLTQGMKYWAINATNSSGAMNSSGILQFNLTVSAGTPDTTAPVVNLISPTNGSTQSNATISFNATFSDNINVTNATFYIWNSTGLINSTTTNLTGTVGSVNLSFVAPYEGTFLWNYQATDNSSNRAFNATNFTVIYSLPDAIPPSVIINSPLNNSNVTTYPFTIINWTLFDKSTSNDVDIYSSNDTSVIPNSLIYHQTGLTNGTSIFNYSAAPINPNTTGLNLLLHMDLSGSGNYSDSSLKGVQDMAQITGTPTLVNGRIAGGIQVSTGNTISINSTPELNSSSEYTVMGWFNMTSTGTTSTCGADCAQVYPIVAKGVGEAEGDSSKDVYYLIGVTAGSKMAAGYERVNDSLAVSVNGSTTINTNTWYHFAVVRNSSSYVIYLNGIQDGINNSIAASTAPTQNSTQRIGIGVTYNSAGATQGVFNGVIDEIAYFNRSMSATEVNSYYNLSQNSKHYFYINATDSSGNLNKSNTIGFNFAQSTTPVVVLTLPTNGTTSLISNISFNASFTEDVGLANATLLIWNSSNTLINSTLVNITGLINATNISLSLPYQGTFVWNYLASDISGNVAQATNNLTVIYNSSVPPCSESGVSYLLTPYINSWNETDEVIRFETNQSTNFTLQYGLTSNYGTNITNATFSNKHEFDISTLTRGTQYFYKVAVANNTGASCFMNTSFSSNFTTNDYTDKNFSFIVLGDSRENACGDLGANFNTIMTNAMKKNPDFIFFIGDMVQQEACTGAGQDDLAWQIFHNVTGNWMMSKTAFNAIGNHEDPDRNESRVSYRNYWVAPLNGNGSIDEWNETTFSWRYGNSLFIVLNSEEINHNGDIADSTGQWGFSNSTQALQATGYTHKFVFSHRPLYISTRAGSLNADNPTRGRSLHDEMSRDNVTVAFAGHDHNYCFNNSDSNGMIDIITGGAGSPLAAPTCTASVKIQQFHYTYITVNGGVMNGTAYNLTDNVIHSFARTMSEPSGADTIPPTISFGTGTETNNSIYSRNNIVVNITATDETALSNITIQLFNTTSLVNRSFSTTSPFLINFTGLIDGNYTFNATSTDSSNNMNSTSSRIVKIDATAPLITINTPTNVSYTSLPIFNVTLNEAGGTVLYSLDGGKTNNSMSTTNNLIFNATNTSIADGSYTFKVYSNDTTGNRNDTVNISFSFENSQVSTCKNLTINGTTYSLSQSITTSTNDCFTILANNIVFNGQGKSLISTDHLEDAINSTGFTNITILNFSISGFDTGISLTNVSNSSVSNSSIRNNSNLGISIKYSNANIVNNNYLVNNTYNIYLLSSLNTTVNNNTILANFNGIEGIYLIGGSNYSIISNNVLIDNGYGIDMSDSSNNSIFNNVINLSSNDGILIAGSSNSNNFTNNSIGSPTTHAFAIINPSSNNFFYNNLIMSTGLSDAVILSGTNNKMYGGVITNTPQGNAIRFSGGTSTNLTNVTILGTSASFYDIDFGASSKTYLIDMPHIGRWGAGGNLISFKNSQFGSIEFTQTVSGTGTNLTSNVTIKNNSAFVDSLSIPGLNKSANITLFGLPTNMNSPKILKNGQICTDCYNFTSLNAGTVIFNVSSWTNYTINSSGSDNIPPSITINFPANGSSYATGQLPFKYNVTISETGFVSFSFDNGLTNTSMNSNNLEFSYTDSTRGEGTYVFTAFANDTVGNLNSTNITFTVTTPHPSTDGGGNNNFGGSTGSNGNSTNINVCDYIYSFLVAKYGDKNYTVGELSNLSKLINVYSTRLYSNSDLIPIIDNFETICNKTLPQRKYNLISQNLTIFNYNESTTECNPDINSTLTLLNTDFNMDSSFPFFHISIGKVGCTGIDVSRWIFKIQTDGESYKIIGLKLWWILSGILIGVIFLTFKSTSKFRKR